MKASLNGSNWPPLEKNLAISLPLEEKKKSACCLLKKVDDLKKADPKWQI